MFDEQTSRMVAEQIARANGITMSDGTKILVPPKAQPQKLPAHLCTPFMRYWRVTWKGVCRIGTGIEIVLASAFCVIVIPFFLIGLLGSDEKSE